MTWRLRNKHFTSLVAPAACSTEGKKHHLANLDTFSVPYSLDKRYETSLTSSFSMQF